MPVNSILRTAPQHTSIRFSGNSKENSQFSTNDSAQRDVYQGTGPSPEIIMEEGRSRVFKRPHISKGQKVCLVFLGTLAAITATVTGGVLGARNRCHNNGPDGKIANIIGKNTVGARGGSGPDNLCPTVYVTEDGSIEEKDSILYNGFHKIAQFHPGNGLLTSEDNNTFLGALIGGRDYYRPENILSPTSDEVKSSDDPGSLNVTVNTKNPKVTSAHFSPYYRFVDDEGVSKRRTRGSGNKTTAHAELTGEAKDKKLSELPLAQQLAVKAATAEFGS
ncbi:MAG: hypothetical protein K0Q50_1172 [Vampirovibrio sp.]|jgi:hypothetical protein|nr:hypothetical protein [Vampirovibrio sp.]